MIKKKKMKRSSKSTDCGSGGVEGRSSDFGNALAGVENGFSKSEISGGSSKEAVRTYKRRKYTKMKSSQAEVLENVDVAVDTSRQFPDKTPGGTCEEVEKCPSPSEMMINRFPTSAKEPTSVTCRGSSCKSSSPNTELCGKIFVDIMKSENFTQLCDLLWKNFEGAKMDSCRDIHRIKTKMKEGAYEKSLMLFQSDMQKVWERLQNVGAEIISLSKSLMDTSAASFSQQFSELDPGPTLEDTKAFGGVSKTCTCPHCGKKAEGRDSLACDTCEELYHVSCIDPPLEEIPTKTWFCKKCVAKGAELAIDYCHVNCIACDNLTDISRSTEDKDGLSNHKGDNICNICKTEVLESKSIKICGHSECPHKYYHMNCLTSKQLSTYGHCWYCPSCLCRTCLTDKDDHEIVLCDGCDHAYHIYCMQPPRREIPRGNWFCVKCDLSIQKITKARLVYERRQSRVISKKGKGIVTGNSRGVDMLLSAARTLKCEEYAGKMKN